MSAAEFLLLSKSDLIKLLEVEREKNFRLSELNKQLLAEKDAQARDIVELRLKHPSEEPHDG